MGGNIFKGTKPIKKENIEPTVDEFFKELKQIFPKKRYIFNKKKFIYLGSVGKKPESGDIDFGINLNDIMSKNLEKTCLDWEIDYKAVSSKWEQYKKRARTSTPKETMVRAVLWGISQVINSKAPNIYTEEKKITPNAMFNKFPQYTSNGEKLPYGVQMDFLIGNQELLKFSYFSKAYEGKIKGLHRTQLVLSMFQAIGIRFQHAKGLSNKETNEHITSDPVKIKKILQDTYGRLDIDDYHSLSKAVKKQPKKLQDTVFDIYFRILQYTKGGIIPGDLVDIWKRLHQKNNYDTRYINPDMLESHRSFRSFLIENNYKY